MSWDCRLTDGADIHKNNRNIIVYLGWLVGTLVAIGALALPSSRQLLARNEADHQVRFELPPGGLALSPDYVVPLRVPLGVSDGTFTNLHINQWMDGAVAQRLVLTEDATKRTWTLTSRRINRHRDFDLTRFMRPGHAYSLTLEIAETGGRAFLDELTVRSFPGLPAFPPLGLILAVLFGLTVIASRLRGKRPLRDVRAWELVGAVAVAAFFMRWHALGATYGQPLEGDAGIYRDLALAMSWASPFQNGIREPLYLWVQRAWMSGVGADIWKFRAATLLMSVGSVVALYALVVALSGRRRVAVAACLLAAIGEYAVVDAVRGERSQLFALLILVYSWGAVAVPPRGKRREALLGALAGLIAWTWLVGAIGAALAYLYRWGRWKIPLVRAAGFWLVLGAMIGGFLVQQRNYRGDALQTLNVHVNFYKNAAATGDPSYAGEKTDWFQYLLGDHGARRVLTDGATGAVDLLFNPTNPFNKIFLGFHYSEPTSYFLYPFLLLGYAVTLLRRRWGGWALMMAQLNVSAALLHTVRDPRLFYHLLPFFAYFFAEGVAAAGDLVRRWGRRPSASRRSAA